MTNYETSARQAAVRLVRVLRDAGHQAYFAGGCVRDVLLGKAPKDYDVATDAQPGRVRELFPHSRYVGEAFGVVLVSMLGELGERGDVVDDGDACVDDPDRDPTHAAADATHSAHEPGTHAARTTRDGRWIHTIEVATFRTEWGYADGRRPTGVAFGDAEHDARRRDFTINGLFEDPLVDDASMMEASTFPADLIPHPTRPRIIDYVDGQRDLYAGILRAIGDPGERFGEDYLRLLRAVRFAARMDFRLDPPTARAIRHHAGQLTRISRERIGQEVEAMLTGPRPARCLRLMQRLGLDGPVLNEPPARPPLRTAIALSHLARIEPIDYITMLAAWMIDRHLLVAMSTQATAMINAEPDTSNTSNNSNTTSPTNANPNASAPSDPAPSAAPPDLAAHWSRIIIQSLPPVAGRWRTALCLPNHQRDALRHLIEGLAQALHWPTLPVAKRKRLLARPTWPGSWALLRAMPHHEATAPIAAQIARDAPPLHAQGVAPIPLITGDDLLAIGITPGPRLGRLLESIYDLQLEQTITTREQALEQARNA